MRSSLGPIAVACALCIAGCASRPQEAPIVLEETAAASVELNAAALASLTPTTPAIFVAPSAPFVAIPIVPSDAPISDDALAPASIVRLTRDADATPDAWLQTAAWRRAQPDEQADATFLLVPREALGDSESISFGERDVSIVRAPDAPLRAESTTLPDAFSRFAPVLRDASLRWRARTALRLHGLDASSLGEFEDPAIEAFAAAFELRADAAIARLAEYDAALAFRLRRMLGRTLTFPEGVIAPAWPAADRGLDDVLAVALDRAVPDAAAADRTRQWLDALDRAIAWVADDAGPLGARALVAELTGSADLLSVRVAPSDTCDPPTLAPVLVGTVAEFDMRCRAAPGRRTLRLSIGEWSTSLDVFAAPIEVDPPGVRAGPFMLPHTMRSLLSDQIALPDAAHATAALVRRKAGSAQWEIYAECLAPDLDSRDTLRVWFGKRDAPRARVELRADGVASRMRFDSLTTGAAVETTAVIRVLDDRWVCFLDIPEDAFEPDGSLVIGFERIDARGVRSVWPRPVLPWDETPSRIAIDPASWPRLGAN
ncbi:MAG: hypothetical protein ACTS27_03670 [Phycisphaerales bacterium]